VAKPWEAKELERIFAEAFVRHDDVQSTRLRADATGQAALSSHERELRRLEAEEPGITRVRRDSDGSIYMD
jgi:hypothetical protein